MEIKTTVSHHFTSVRMAIINISTNNKCWRVWRKGNPSALLVEMKTGAATVETVWNFLRKLKMELPFDPAISLLGLYPKNPETPFQNNPCTPIFIATQFTIVKCCKQSKCPSVKECIKKLWYIYTMEY